MVIFHDSVPLAFILQNHHLSRAMSHFPVQWATCGTGPIWWGTKTIGPVKVWLFVCKS